MVDAPVAEGTCPHCGRKMPKKKALPVEGVEPSYFALFMSAGKDAGAILTDRRPYLVGRIQALGAKVGAEMFARVCKEYFSATPKWGEWCGDHFLRTFDATANRVRARVMPQQEAWEREINRRLGV